MISAGCYGPEAKPVKAIKGPEPHVWSGDRQLEGPLRMLFHVLDAEVAEDPRNLAVHGGTGEAARSWEDFEAMVDALMSTESDETLAVQSGQPVAAFKLDGRAPRILMSNAVLAPKWAGWKTFWELEAKGLIGFRQMAVGCWAYVGTQGISQGAYETIGYAAERRFGGSLGTGWRSAQASARWAARSRWRSKCWAASP